MCREIYIYVYILVILKCFWEYEPIFRSYKCLLTIQATNTNFLQMYIFNVLIQTGGVELNINH